MGSSSSKYKSHMLHGDEVSALHVLNNSNELQKNMDANASYGDVHNHYTPLLLSAKGGMRTMMRKLLDDYGGNPNKKTKLEETSLHLLCRTDHGLVDAVQEVRLDCLRMLLEWEGVELEEGGREKLNVEAQDELDNTGLHYAAQSGMGSLVEILVQRGANLFVENADGLTPCDMGERAGHAGVATYLESKMVFSDRSDESEDILEVMEDYHGLRHQELQEAKDKLLVETADMLGVPLFTAQVMLQKFEWSRQKLLDSWMLSPKMCFKTCGIDPPPQFNSSSSGGTDLLLSPGLAEHSSHGVTECSICTVEVTKLLVPLMCGHMFCRDCWQRYLTDKIRSGSTGNIRCPGHECPELVPVEMAEQLVPRDVARRYLQYDIQEFVETNPQLKWCPQAGCGRAVQLPEVTTPHWGSNRRGVSDSVEMSRAVDCGGGHCFCWDCGQGAHEPCSCEKWKLWFEKIAEVNPEDIAGTGEQSENAANFLWLVTNSKSCPNCRAPIQKNEGCNHMKCSKCKHDFCWVCLEVWKRHSSSTGGYFRCNRFEAVNQVEQKRQEEKVEAEERNKKIQEMNRFAHYYTRFKNHENSYKLEEPLLRSATEKMLVLAKAVTDPGSAEEATKFVEEAVETLLKARRTLKCSYAFAFHFQDQGMRKTVFEHMQTSLEEAVEDLSQMVNRPYLRTPKHVIVAKAVSVRRHRRTFLTSIEKGLIPNETPPSLARGNSWRLDDDYRESLLSSLGADMPSSPQGWQRDPTGRDVNTDALVAEWPVWGESSSADPPSGDGECVRVGCKKPRKKAQSGRVLTHCSWKCFQADKSDRLAQEARRSGDESSSSRDFGLDLLHALRLSSQSDDDSYDRRREEAARAAERRLRRPPTPPTPTDEEEPKGEGEEGLGGDFDRDLHMALTLSRIMMADAKKDGDDDDEPDTPGPSQQQSREDLELELAIALSLGDSHPADTSPPPAQSVVTPARTETEVDTPISLDHMLGACGGTDETATGQSGKAEASERANEGVDANFGPIKCLNISNLFTGEKCQAEKVSKFSEKGNLFDRQLREKKEDPVPASLDLVNLLISNDPDLSQGGAAALKGALSAGSKSDQKGTLGTQSEVSVDIAKVPESDSSDKNVSQAAATNESPRSVTSFGDRRQSSDSQSRTSRHSSQTHLHGDTGRSSSDLAEDNASRLVPSGTGSEAAGETGESRYLEDIVVLVDESDDTSRYETYEV